MRYAHARFAVAFFQALHAAPSPLRHELDDDEDDNEYDDDDRHGWTRR